VQHDGNVTSNDGTIEYYEGRTLRGQIPLSKSCRVEIHDRHQGTFALITPFRTYELRTERENMCDSFDLWISSIRQVVAVCPVVPSMDADLVDG
jgi:hypothetical protein